MSNIKKFALTILFFVLSLNLSSTANAQVVRVSDLGLERFVDKCNVLLSTDGKHMEVSGDCISDNLYDKYMGGVGKNNGVLIIFYVNKSGYVSSLNIITKNQNSSLNLAGKIIGACLIAIGLTDKEYDVFNDRLLRSDSTTAKVWGSKINRYVGGYVEEQYIDGESYIGITIGATDN